MTNTTNNKQRFAGREPLTFWSAAEAMVFAEQNASGPFTCLLQSGHGMMKHPVVVTNQSIGAPQWSWWLVGNARA